MHHEARQQRGTRLAGALLTCTLLYCGCDAPAVAPPGGGSANAGGGLAATAGSTSVGGTASGSAGTFQATKSGSSSGGGAVVDGGSTGAGGFGGSAQSGVSGGGASQPGSAGSTTDGGCGAAQVCEDFERETVGEAPHLGPFRTGDDPNHPSGSVVVDSAQHYSGSKSVKVTTPSGGRSAMLRLAGAPFFPAAGNAFFGRMMYRVEALPDVNNHTSFIEAGGVVPGAVGYHAVYRYGSQRPAPDGSHLLASYETDDGYKGIGPKSDCGKASDTDILESAVWSCIEWYFDGAGRKLRLWLNGAAIEKVWVDGSGTNCVSQPADYPWTAPLFDHVDVGWASYQADGARAAWVDDLVISPTRVGCPKAP